jgi:multiple sugar transport system permease protein
MGAMADQTVASVRSGRRPRPQNRRLKSIFGRDWSTAYPFVLPMVILMIGLVAWPFLEAIRLSGTSLNYLTGETSWVGFRNYAKLLTSSDYHQAIGNTFTFTFWSLLIKLMTGMTIALILNSRLPYRNVLSGIMLLPWIVPEIVTALTWKSIYDPLFGSLNPILLGAGIIDRPLGWLSDPYLAMPSIIAVNVWKGIPFFVLLFLAGLKAVDREQLEAAEIDGASVVQRFRHVTLPSMRYVIVVTLLLSFISTFNQFGLPFLMTGGGPSGATKLYSILAYEKAIGSLQYGPGAAIAISVAPLMAVLIWLLARFMRHDDRQRPARGSSIGDRLSRRVSRLFSRLLDAVFWPLEMALRALSFASAGIGRALGRGDGQPTLKREGQRRASLAFRLVVLLPFVGFVMFPFYWVLITSLKTTPQISERRSIFWPDPFTTEQYRSLLLDTPFVTWLWNSVVVALVSTLISVAFAALAAYALSRLKFLGAGLLTTVLLITYLLPATLIFIPLYQILATLGLVNTHSALMLTYPTFLLPFATWVLLGYFRSIPVELEEAAMIDGASRLYTFAVITLPLAAPAILSVTLVAFTTAWNEFLFAFVFITSESLRTLPIGLQSMVVGDILPWGKLMAASLLTAIPVAVLYVYAQRDLTEGLTVGGVKG